MRERERALPPLEGAPSEKDERHLVISGSTLREESISVYMHL